MLALYVLVLGETGARCESEALRIRWEDVDLEGGFLWIASGRDGHRTKSGKGRWVPLSARLIAAMRAHFARFRFAGSPWVFHHDRTQRHYRAGDRVVSFYHSFKRAAERASVSPELRQHDLRHRRVTTLLAKGKSAAQVKEMMGHADLRTTMGYAHLVREHLRDLMDDGPALVAPARRA